MSLDVPNNKTKIECLIFCCEKISKSNSEYCQYHQSEFEKRQPYLFMAIYKVNFCSKNDCGRQVPKPFRLCFNCKYEVDISKTLASR